MGFVYTKNESGQELAYECPVCAHTATISTGNFLAEHFEVDNWLDYYKFTCTRCGETELNFSTMPTFSI